MEVYVVVLLFIFVLFYFWFEKIVGGIEDRKYDDLDVFNVFDFVMNEFNVM